MIDAKGYLRMCGGEREREGGRVKCSEEEEAQRQAPTREGFVLVCFNKEERKIFGVRKIREKEFHIYIVCLNGEEVNAFTPLPSHYKET